MTDIVVRPLSADDDLEALNEGYTFAWSALQWRSASEESDTPVSLFAAELDGVPVGMAVVMRAPYAVGGSAPGLLSVVPGARRRGVGTALRRAVEDEVRGIVPGVTYPYDVRSTDSAAAVSAWGLPIVARHRESLLDLTALRPELARRAQVDGVEIRSLPPLDRMDEAEWESLHTFVQARIREAPDSGDGGGDLPLEAFRGLVREPWMLFEALENRERIGVTFVMGRGPHVVNTFFTGVHEPARGRGVAIALKSAQALRMAKEGITAVYTQNMPGNEPILAANRALGFVPDSEYVEVLAQVS